MKLNSQCLRSLLVGEYCRRFTHDSSSLPLLRGI